MLYISVLYAVLKNFLKKQIINELATQSFPNVLNSGAPLWFDYSSVGAGDT